MGQPPYLSQYDNRWRMIPYTIISDKNQNIGSSGCGITCMAMVLQAHGHNVLPPDTAKLALEMHDRSEHDGTEWEYFGHVAKKYSLDLVESSSTGDAVKALKDGALIICSMGPGYFTRSGHFILAWGLDPNGNILVNDPANQAKNKAGQTTFRNECRRYFIFRKQVEKLDWKQIIEKVASNPEQWEKAINAAAAAAKADSNLGDLEIMQYLPQLIEKVYNAPK
jgi:ABC-type bacteriocin/lantibiotic exporter with double-glycine peptidase domain